MMSCMHALGSLLVHDHNLHLLALLDCLECCHCLVERVGSGTERLQVYETTLE